MHTLITSYTTEKTGQVNAHSITSYTTEKTGQGNALSLLLVTLQRKQGR